MDLGAAVNVNEEGMALLKFKERVKVDPYGALLKWNEDDINPCSWFGIACSYDGKVEALELRNLHLKGTLGPELGKLINMKYIMLQNNSFSGVVPREIGNLNKLKVLNLGFNNLSEPLPLELNSISTLEILILRGNKFITNISPRYHKLSSLLGLQLDGDRSNSKFRHLIKSIRNRTLQRVIHVTEEHKGKDHQKEKIHVNVPRTFPLHQLLISPRVIHVTEEHKGNDLHKETIQVKVPSPMKPSSAAAISKPQHNYLWIIIVSVAGGVLFVVAISVFCGFYCRKNKDASVRPLAMGLSAQLQKPFITDARSFKLLELEKACEDFSNIIGSSSGCTLYKGTLPSGVEIAVMTHTTISTKDWLRKHETQFREEVSTLSRVNHKNFVNLLGFCEERQPFSRMMVFEYAPNGTLHEHLHGKEAEHLDWASRMRIAMGIAYCLEHMVYKLDPPVFLSNLGSSSVYLTNDLAAKVSDLEYWNSTKESTSTSGNSGSSNAQSTLGASLVLKFGILLLEIISGKLSFQEDDGLLVLWASSFLTGKRLLEGIVDPTIEPPCMEVLRSLCKVIHSCIRREPWKRPTMAEIAHKLREITKISPSEAAPSHSPLVLQALDHFY
ncbi:hypothetical protein J5N97_005986 [Dioscorea zingiberensis]|uniref:Protein kinase domain-containing protein n=1 Tax=Dioscorea zingiberensis TaxID=325984 RepID=A0A9D5HSD8_9LILI|nr:hypothetical protein J5N97_005986 [Dioscorea zingiberensis]